MATVQQQSIGPVLWAGSIVATLMFLPLWGLFLVVLSVELHWTAIVSIHFALLVAAIHAVRRMGTRGRRRCMIGCSVAAPLLVLAAGTVSSLGDPPDVAEEPAPKPEVAPGQRPLLPDALKSSDSTDRK